MKKTVLLLLHACLLFLCIHEKAFAEWSVMPTSTTNLLQSIWGNSSNDIFAVGSYKTILHFNGKAWSSMTTTPYYHYNCVWGSSATDVYSVGFSGYIYRYNGTAWTVQEQGTVTTSGLYAIGGSSATNVYAAGQAGTVVHYDGTAWHVENHSLTTAVLWALWCSPDHQAFIAGSGGTILRYNGTGWSKMTTNTSATLYGIWGTSATDIYAVGASGTVLHYNGSSWQKINHGLTTAELRSIWGNSSSNIYAVGNSGTILHYDGSAWTQLTSGTTNSLSGVWVSPTAEVFAVGYQGFIISEDNDGINSSEYNCPFMYNPDQLDTDGDAIGNLCDNCPLTANADQQDSDGDGIGDVCDGSDYDGDGIIDSIDNCPFIYNPDQSDSDGDGFGDVCDRVHEKSNSLQGWQWENPLPQGNDLACLWIADQNTVYAAGKGGTIIHSSDNGATWLIDERLTSYTLNGILGWGSDQIFAVGDFGTVLFYNGIEWHEVKRTTNNHLRAIGGTSADNIFVAGDNGTVLHYDGSQWQKQSTPVAEHLRALWVKGSNDVYAVGGSRKVSGDTVVGTGGVIIHYDGTQWSRVEHNLPDMPNFNGIWGTADGRLYIAGGDRANSVMSASPRTFYGTGARIVYYNGQNWDVWNPGDVDWNFNAVWGDQNELYAAGEFLLQYSGDHPITSGKLYRHTGENSWEEISVENGNINGLQAVRGCEGGDVFAIGSYGTILHKGTAGWHELSYGTRWSRFFNVGGVYPGQLFAADGTWDGRQGTIVRYDNETGLWKESYKKPASFFLGVWAAARNSIYVVGDETMHFNGSAWETVSTCDDNHFTIWGTGPNDIYTWGHPCHFDGTEWTSFCPELTGSQWHGAVWGTGSDDIFAVGDYGMVLHSDGMNCSLMYNPGDNVILRGIWGTDDHIIYAVGGSEASLTSFTGILYYDGTAWQQIDFPHIKEHMSPVFVYFGVWGTGPDDIYIGGFNGGDGNTFETIGNFHGIMLHKAGSRWEDISNGMGSFFNFVWGVNKDIVYTGGDGSAILRYTPPERGSIAGCVKNIQGEPIGAAQVSLYALGGSFWYTLDAQTTLESGCFQLGDLLPGRYYFVLNQEGMVPQRYPAQGSLRLTAGETLNLGAIVFGDFDGDGIPDLSDNCPESANGPLQGTCLGGGTTTSCDDNEDCGIGAICSMNQEDFDGDSVGDACDICPSVYNPGQEKSITVTLGSLACENTATREAVFDDTDCDGIAEECWQLSAGCEPPYLNLICDNCPGMYNPDQKDSDNDGIGDACEPVLISLSSFTASSFYKKVVLSWSTESEVKNAGYNLHRAEEENGTYIKVNTALIPAKGSSAQGASYEYEDKNVKLWKTYYYKLEDIDLSGKSTMHGPVSVSSRIFKNKF